MKEQKNLPVEKVTNNLRPEYKNNVTDAFHLRHRILLNKGCMGIRSVNVTSDDKYLVITHELNPRIRVVDLQKLDYMLHTFSGHTDTVRLSCIASDNRHLFTTSWDGSARKFDLITGKCLQVFSGFGRSPSCFYDESSNKLFIASYDGDLDLDASNTGRCWDAITGSKLYIYLHEEPSNSPESMDIATDGNWVYTGSDDGVAYRWPLRGGRPILKYFSCSATVRKIHVSRRFLGAACTDGIVRVHDKYNGSKHHYFQHKTRDIREVRISRDESRIWTAGEDGYVNCFDLNTGKLIFEKKLHPLWIWSMCLMRNESIIVTGGGEGYVIFSNANTGKIIAQFFNLPDEKNFLIACPPDKNMPTGFFFSTARENIQLLKVNDKREVKEEIKPEDSRFEHYYDKHNLKNLVITRLKNSDHYNSLTKNYRENTNILDKINGKKSILMLKE